MMLNLEIVNQYSRIKTGEKLIYSSSCKDFMWLETRCYQCKAAGNRQSIEQFLTDLLINRHAERLHVDQPPAVFPFCFFVDIVIKDGHVDLEQAYIMRYCTDAPPPDVSIQSIKPVRRIYVIQSRNNVDPGSIIRDSANPVIHNWRTVYAQ